MGHLKKTGCSDRWGLLVKAPARLQRCSSAKRRGCTSVLTYSRSGWPVRRQGRSQCGNNQLQPRNIRLRSAVVSVAPSLRICLLGDPELEPGGSRYSRSACFMAEGEGEIAQSLRFAGTKLGRG
jgi:hypothetical protein